MNLSALPAEIIEMIKDSLWGNLNSYKNKFCIGKWLNNYKKPINIDQAHYCNYCGERKYILPANNICLTCERMINTNIAAYPYNTWSGLAQGHFILHNKIICLYAGKVSPLEKNILCVRGEYPYIHPRV